MLNWLKSAANIKHSPQFGVGADGFLKRVHLSIPGLTCIRNNAPAKPSIAKPFVSITGSVPFVSRKNNEAMHAKITIGAEIYMLNFSGGLGVSL